MEDVCLKNLICFSLLLFIIILLIIEFINKKDGNRKVKEVVERLKNRNIIINHTYKWPSVKNDNICHLKIINLYYDYKNDAVIIRYYLCDNYGRINLYAYEANYVLSLIDDCVAEFIDCGE